MNRLVRTPRRRIVQVIPQIHVQLLARADVPRRLVRAIQPSHAPLQVVAAKCKRAVCVFRLGEADGERVAVDHFLGRNYGVEKFGRSARGGNELDELTVDDLELAFF